MVKKILIASALLLASMSASASNYFTLGVNDTLRVAPSNLDGQMTQIIRAHFDGRLDQWSVSLFFPQGMVPQNFNEGDDMTISYKNCYLRDTIYSAQLYHNYVQGGYGLAANITVPGYWDYNGDGIPESYGTVKWEAGDYGNMFTYLINIANDFTGGTITVSGWVASSNDARGGTIATNPDSFQRTITVVVGYKRGDVNGDGAVNMGDVATLTNYLLNGDGLDQYKLEAADVTGDGLVNTADLGMLTNMILNS